MHSHPFRSLGFLAALLAGAAFPPSSLRAQQRAAADSDSSAAQAPTVATPAPVAVLAGPRVAPVGVQRLVHAPSIDIGQPPDESAHVGVGSNLAMMGAGAAAVVVGLMIGGNGGTLVALGGGVIGLIGLYRYLR
jgi:hypothetical protein